MASEITIARESKANPINALKRTLGGGKATDDDRKNYFTTNRDSIISGLSRYYGQMSNVQYAGSFSGKDTDGKTISGTKVRYTDSRGHWGQEARYSDDGYVVNGGRVGMGNGEYWYTKLSRYKIW